MATIPNAGLTALATQVNAGFAYLALDASDAAESITHTAPQTEITTAGGARAAATPTVETYKSVLTKTFTFTGPLTIWAVCVMSAATAGTMLMRHLFTASKNVVDTDTLTIVTKMDNTRPA